MYGEGGAYTVTEIKLDPTSKKLIQYQKSIHRLVNVLQLTRVSF